MFGYAFDNDVMRSHTLRSIALPALYLLLLAAPALQAAPQSPAPAQDFVRQVQLAVDRLQEWYIPRTGLWKSTGWWNAANALTAIVDYSRVTRATRYEPVIAQTYAANQSKGFLNEYYDDEGWWALAWIDAYDLTGNPDYLRAAEGIFDDMAGGWDDTCGGGVWWSKSRHYKNAIANELFLSVAAHLANRVKDPARKVKDLTWAEREWRWFRGSGMIERDHLISDGLTQQCQNNHQTKWSYNQGVILGGLDELSLQHGQRGTLREARRIADAAIDRLANGSGILHEPCEPQCGIDGTQFKGIFMRNLALLNQRAPSPRYSDFIRRNAETMLANDQDSEHSFGVVWSGPPESANASTQSSAIDGLVAALAVQEGHLH